MGYPRDLDEYSDREIVREHSRRMLLRSKKRCTYCTHFYKDCKCKMKENKNNFQYVDIQFDVELRKVGLVTNENS